MSLSSMQIMEKRRDSLSSIVSYFITFNVTTASLKLPLLLYYDDGKRCKQGDTTNC